MSQPCAISSCKRLSRAVCHCCKQNVCIPHLTEHQDVPNSKLNSFADEVNVLIERLQTIDMQKKGGYCRRKLEQWRIDCHEKIDRFFNEKCQELDQLVAIKPKKLQNEIHHVQEKLVQLVKDQETTQQDVDSLTSRIRYLEGEMTTIDQTCVRIIIQPFVLDHQSITFQEKNEQTFDLSIRYPIYKTISYPLGSWFPLATNDHYLLFHQIPNLCLVNQELTIIKQIIWPYAVILNTCWSSALNGFIVLTENNIYLIDEKKLSIEKILTNPKQNWLTCACSNFYLFVSTNQWGSSIVQYSLSLTIDLIKEWQVPKSCTKDECIETMVSHNETLALIIRNKCESSIRIELRFSETFDCIWSLRLDAVHDLSHAFRCCSLTCGDWLVINCETRQLFQITKSGILKMQITYGRIPHRVILFGENFLVIATDAGLNFHKLKLDF
jgi:hypothetical protein